MLMEFIAWKVDWPWVGVRTGTKQNTEERCRDNRLISDWRSKYATGEMGFDLDAFEKAKHPIIIFWGMGRSNYSAKR
jgi:hypothetical protein